ncbi:monocopper oxidase-like protein SKS1 [Corylus avellana]|uniref:monocopper oxidase-like protein SKS1 n=1 Tax=Corylus avellana TaxID=13451 RepID=UPI00286B16C2|nr:monocopper oxidase-like protein SKS1 [Corylus avellana]
MGLTNCLRFITSTILWVSAALVHAESSPIFLDWTISYSHRAPLGVEKQVIVINDQFPGPLLNATTNDVVNIKIHNNLVDPFLMTWNGVQLRRNSWQDGVQETNCPILPGQRWTYSFQIKDQIGGFFYFPSLLFQKAAGGYGAIRMNNRPVIPLPFPHPYKDLDILIGDWYNTDYRLLRALLDVGNGLPDPDGVLINGLGPKQAIFEFEPGATYRLRISNVGLKTSLNFRIQGHVMRLVETEGSYTIQKDYNNLDIHVGQSYSVLVTAKKQINCISYYMIASSRFTQRQLLGLAIIRHPGSVEAPMGPITPGPAIYDYTYSISQAHSIRWNLMVGAARLNPQGSYHYGNIDITRTLILKNGVMSNGHEHRYTVNGVSFVHQDTPLKLADYFRLTDASYSDIIPDTPNDDVLPTFGTSIVEAVYRDFFHVVFQNPCQYIQTWHLDGYSFFVVGMEFGTWDESKKAGYNMVDAVSRSTVQVYPFAWTAILVKLDNQGLWNLRSQNAENWYLGQELYIRVKGVGEEDPSTIPVEDEAPIPANVIKCGQAIL